MSKELEELLRKQRKNCANTFAVMSGGTLPGIQDSILNAPAPELPAATPQPLSQQGSGMKEDEWTPTGPDIIALDNDLREFYTKNKSGKGSGYAIRAIKHFAANYQSPQPDKEPESQREELNMVEMPRPIGDFILNQKDVHPHMGNDGAYYHYSDVCTMLKRVLESGWPTPTSAKTDKEIEELAERILIDHKMNTNKWGKLSDKEVIAAMTEIYKAKPVNK